MTRNNNIILQAAACGFVKIYIMKGSSSTYRNAFFETWILEEEF